MTTRAFVLVAACWAASTVAQQPLRDATLLRTVTGCGELVTIASDGSCLAVIDTRRGVALLIDAESGDVRELTGATAITAVAPSPRATPVWLGTRDGALLLSREQPRAADRDDADDARAIDARAADGQLVTAQQLTAAAITWLGVTPGAIAWASRDAGCIGAVDARTGQPLWRAALTVRSGTQPGTSRDGRHLAVVVVRERESTAVVFDTRTGREVATAPTYHTHRAAELAFTDAALCTAHRVGSNRWQLERLDLITLQSSVIDADLRGGHFVDLLASPHSGLLLEGDFEEHGASLYDLAQSRGDRAPRGGAPRQLGAKGVMPLGFAQVPSTQDELVLTTAGPLRNGMSAWSGHDGSPVAEDLPFARGKRIERAGSLLGGSRLWFSWWDAPDGRAVVRHVELHAIGE